MSELFHKGKKILIASLTVGDPDCNSTTKFALAMAEGGADMVELCIPFSDPSGAGSAVVKSYCRALDNRTTTDDVFNVAERIHSSSDVKICIVSYLNSIFVYGYDRFMKKCKESGISAVFAADLPYEEKNELLVFARKYDVKLISAVAPSKPERIEKISKEAEGFLYSVVTSSDAFEGLDLCMDPKDIFDIVRKNTDVPCIAAGLVTSYDVSKADYTDGVILDIENVSIIEKHGKNSAPYIREYVSDIRKALDG